MPYKDKELQKAAKAAWYERNKELQRERTRDRRNQKRKWIEEYKKENSICADCGISYPPHILDFDHLRDKSFQIGGTGIKDKTLQDIIKEIQKCEIVCSNCHRHRTWMRSKNTPR